MVNNKMHSNHKDIKDFGTYTWKNGDVYKGRFVEDKRTGLGTMIYKDKGTYKGQWLNN